MHASTKRLISSIPFLLPVLVLLPEANTVPIFDARVYADCAATLATHPTWAGLTCAGHPSHAYMAFVALLLAPSPGSVWLLFLAHLVLLLGGIFAFRRIFDRLFPAPELWWERELVASVLATSPVLLGSTLHYNPDLAVFTCALLVLERLLAKSRWGAMLFGLGLCFAKEIGIVFFGAMLLVEVLTVTRGPGEPKEKLRTLARLWPLALPIVLFVGRAATTPLVVPPDNASGVPSIAADFLAIRLLDGVFRSYAAAITILHFQWLQTAMIAVWIAVLAARVAFARRAFPEGQEGRSWALTLALFVAFFTVATRYRTYSSPRYLLAVYPIMLLATYAATWALAVPRRIRAGFFGVAMAAGVASIWATVDPVSRLVYGTFSFGSHTMLKTTSITSYIDRRNSGYGRDQLVNNLQFTSIPHLQNEILANLPPPPLGPFLVDDATLWFMWGSVDPQTNRRIFARGGPTVPVIGLRQLVKAPPKDCLYVLYPMFAEIQENVLATLTQIYRIARRTPVELDGYRIEILSLHLDEAALEEIGGGGPKDKP